MLDVDPDVEASVAEGVGYDVAEDLADSGRVGPGDNHVSFYRYVSVLGDDAFDDLGGLGVEGDGDLGDGELAEFGSGRYQEVVDQVGQVEGLLGDGLDHLTAFGLSEIITRVVKELGETDYCGEWGS